uniref:Uncharacterized protein n=1 Tax=Oryza meridionalis TaxID=40149 RepID=A0A0E0CI16_9ORYZ
MTNEQRRTLRKKIQDGACGGSPTPQRRRARADSSPPPVDPAARPQPLERWRSQPGRRRRRRLAVSFSSLASCLLAECLLLLGVGLRWGVELGEDPEGGDEGERHEAEEGGGVERHGHGGGAAEAAEVGAHLAPRHLPVALPRQVHHLRRRRRRRQQQIFV